MIEVKNASEWVVRLQDGEDLVDVLRGLDSDAALILLGIGMVREVELGFWNGSTYEIHAYPNPAELLSLQGNLSKDAAGQRIAHVHVSLSRQDGSVRGGHLVAATAHNTIEMGLQSLSGIAMERKPEQSGLVELFPREI